MGVYCNNTVLKPNKCAKYLQDQHLQGWLCCMFPTIHACAGRVSCATSHCRVLLRILVLGPNTCRRAAAAAASQVDNMTNKHAVFMTRDGRISLAGLSSSKVAYLADAIVDSVRNH